MDGGDGWWLAGWMIDKWTVDGWWVDECVNVIFRLVRQVECRHLPKPCFGRINGIININNRWRCTLERWVGWYIYAGSEQRL